MARPYCNGKTRGRRPGNSEGWQIERSPGKFEGEGLLTEWAWEASMEGCSETASRGDGGESYTRLDGPFSRAELRGWRDQDGRQLNRSEIRFANHAAGVILHERSDGFVSDRWFAADDIGRAALERIWEACLEATADPDDESDTPDIGHLDREQIVALLESAGIQCYDHETTDTLRDALQANLDDGTIDPDDIPPR